MNVVLGLQVDAFAQKLGYVVPLQVGLIKLKVCSNYVTFFNRHNNLQSLPREIMGKTQNTCIVPSFHTLMR
jgi:uncharacterized CHY-type Zn-finger protein